MSEHALRFSEGELAIIRAFMNGKAGKWGRVLSALLPDPTMDGCVPVLTVSGVSVAVRVGDKVFLRPTQEVEVLGQMAQGVVVRLKEEAENGGV